MAQICNAELARADHLMSFPKPLYSRNQVNNAGKVLGEFRRSKGGVEDLLRWYEAHEVMANWRSCHGYPINTFQATLRTKLEKLDPKAIVAQRLKRYPSIISKLERFGSMQLSRMQDIAGLRAVVKDLATVRKLRDLYVNRRHASFAHELVTEKDYIARPKSSGYRSVHLVYRYRSKNAPEYDGLLLEMQLRTRLQHFWATAVETLGTFLNTALKASDGPEEWLQFFALTGSAFAQIEGCATVPGYENLTAEETFQRTVAAAKDLRVHEQLSAFTVAADQISNRKSGASYYHLLVLDPVSKNVAITSYGREMLELANSEYTKVEHRIAQGEDLQAVLVAAGPFSTLKRAYPNFFLDTHQFLNILEQIERRKPGKKPVTRTLF